MDKDQNNQILVIMSAYNRADSISEAIDSILSQTFSNWILVIIDDRSNDDTAKIISNYNHPRIKSLYNNKNMGTYVNRNFALIEFLKDCTFWTIQDSDDVSHPDRLKKLYEKAQKSKPLAPNHLYKRISRRSGKLLKTDSDASDGTVLYRKEAFDIIGVYDLNRFCSDSDYLYRFKLFFGEKYYFVINGYLYDAYTRNDNLTCKHGKKKRKKY